jgi:hypothetical protein
MDSLVRGFHISIKAFVAIASSPDGEYRTQLTWPPQLIGFPSNRQVLVLHNFIVLYPSEPVASTAPFGEKSSE